MSAASSAAPDYTVGLTAAQLAQFESDGYLILPAFFPDSEADALKQRADQLLEGFDLATHPRTVFKTAVDGPQTASSANQDANKYFLDSADQIHFFFEEHAFENGQLKYEKSRAINKIGHQLHVLDDAYRAFTYKPEIKAIAKSLGFVTPVVLQSMVRKEERRHSDIETSECNRRVHLLTLPRHAADLAITLFCFRSFASKDTLAVSLIRIAIRHFYSPSLVPLLACGSHSRIALHQMDVFHSYQAVIRTELIPNDLDVNRLILLRFVHQSTIRILMHRYRRINRGRTTNTSSWCSQAKTNEPIRLSSGRLQK